MCCAPTQVLELYSTEGLNPDAVHLSQLNVGEGLVGTIAAQRAASQSGRRSGASAFAYLPETGEEAYHSFLGVPILRNGIVIGVLVVQNADHAPLYDEEEEALQTTAMVLAEMIASGQPHRWRAMSRPTFDHVRRASM
jgi:phosphotransferase system enzyme I (PtsP)